VLGAVGEKASIAVEHLATNGQLDLRRLLDIANPLAAHVRGADESRQERTRSSCGLPDLRP
jgi:hypothetical protein